jgi:hypothetical protein
MADRRIGVIINGATGRMGATQHVTKLLATAPTSVPPRSILLSRTLAKLGRYSSAMERIGGSAVTR